MKRSQLPFLALLFLPALAQLGCENAEMPVIDCATATVPTFSEVTIWSECTNCHASTLTGKDRDGAPDGIDFDLYEAAVQYAEDAAHEVVNGKMPYPSGEGVTEDQKTSLYTWVQCGTPE